MQRYRAKKEFNGAWRCFILLVDPAKEIFLEILQYDAECGMAHWGIAIMSMGNPFAWPASPAAMKGGCLRHGGGAAESARKTERAGVYRGPECVLPGLGDRRISGSGGSPLEKAMEGGAAVPTGHGSADPLCARVNITALPTDKTFH